MQSTILNVLARALSGMSLPMNHRVGAAIGWLAWHTRSNLRTATLINLSLCFPEWSDDHKARIGKASLMETGKALTESFWLWKRPNSDVLARLHIVEGERNRSLQNDDFMSFFHIAFLVKLLCQNYKHLPQHPYWII